MVQIPTNPHHGIPVSCGGSDDYRNRSRVQKPRHAGYHNWAVNYAPDRVARMIACQSIGLEEKGLHPETIATIFRIAEQSATSRFYVREALLPTEYISSEYKMNIEWTKRDHDRKEHHLLKKTIQALKKGDNFPCDTEPFLKDCLSFFKTDIPRIALFSLYSETFRTTLSWVNPVTLDVRKYIHEILSNDPNLEKFTGGGRTKELIRILESQLLFLEGTSLKKRKWQSQVD